METVACILCGGIKSREVYRLSDWLLNRPETEARFVKCEACGLIYQNPRPTIQEMAQHYPDEEYSPYHTFSVKRKSFWLIKAEQYGLDRRCNWARAGKQGGYLLDVGCANGAFLRGMQRFQSWTLAGVEINSSASQRARDDYGLNVFTGTLEEAQFPASTFDVVTLWDVLEHLHDPQTTLKEIYRILKPGGHLVVRIPNADSRDAKWFGPFWAGLDPPRHLHVYGIKQLHKIIERNGFRIQKASCRFGSYPNFVTSIRFQMSARKVNPQTQERIKRFLYHPLVRLMTAPPFFFLSLGLHGSSLTVTAEKVEKI